MFEQAWILASQRSLSVQDPSQPKIPVNPRSQSAQDPSQPWMPSCLLGSCLFESYLFGIWLMPIWYLDHAYRKVASSSLSWLVAHFQIFISLMKGKFDAYVLWPLVKKFQNWIVDQSTACEFTVFDIWLMPIWFMAQHQLNLQIPTWISVIHIWHIHIFPVV